MCCRVRVKTLVVGSLHYSTHPGIAIRKGLKLQCLYLSIGKPCNYFIPYGERIILGSD